MPRRQSWLACAVIAAGLAAPVAAEPSAPDLFFGEALYHAHQGRFFDALERMDAELAQHRALDEPMLDSLYPLLGRAEFSVGDFELNYRMHQRAGRAIQAVLEADVPDPVRNEAAVRLARIHLQKGQLTDALAALDRIGTTAAAPLQAEADFLRASVLLDMGRPDEAATLLRPLQGVRDLRGFSDYNLAVSLWRAGDEPAALTQLERAGTVPQSDVAGRAIRDKANLVMGTLLLESGAYEQARRPLDRVHMDGPFSNQALLSAGWASASAQRFDRAVVPWRILSQRNGTNAAVQEAQLALPYAYSQMAVHGRAALLYGQALANFETELGKLDASITSVRDGRFLEALVREEMRHDRSWAVRLRELPGSPETFYLTELIASHEFQTALANYLDLEELRARLARWQGDFGAYADLLAARRTYFEPMLPGIDEQFRALDSRMRLRLQQQALLEQRLNAQLTSPQPEMLATREERIAYDKVQAYAAALADDEDAATLKARVARVRGALIWRFRTRYHERLTALHRELAALQRATEAMRDTYGAYVRTRQAATNSYEGYPLRFARLKTRVAAAEKSVARLMARQGSLIEAVALAELQMRRERLQGYQTEARFAMADSYDRATKAQQQVSVR